jgi:hypothetical protein
MDDLLLRELETGARIDIGARCVESSRCKIGRDDCLSVWVYYANLFDAAWGVNGKVSASLPHTNKTLLHSRQWVFGILSEHSNHNIRDNI